MRAQIFHNPRCSKSRDDLARELDLSAHDDRMEDQWLPLLFRNPRLIERPMVVVGERAVIGRPPSKILTLF